MNLEKHLSRQQGRPPQWAHNNDHRTEIVMRRKPPSAFGEDLQKDLQLSSEQPAICACGRSIIVNYAIASSLY